ncbi:right-handed parallel beta-helix repeat-containing protein [Portibacter marinus]|uniref:right-handed parallel beta-helix repeat-containing protein n=1 Tax=Portibacter marinus TaxID=2898660 RepID=UPI001F28FD8E|nr:right-handed parallel beta-helix repeat-containing protein [Portibacter marinus]
MKYNFCIWSLLLILISCNSRTQNISEIPGYRSVEHDRLEESTYKFQPIPDNATLRRYKHRTLVVTPNLEYDSWRELIFKNDEIDLFLITPGDYLKWGQLRPHKSGELKVPKIFHYYNPKLKSKALHPVQLQKDEAAILENFNFNEIANWKIYGLTFSGKQDQINNLKGGISNLIINSSDRITIDFCIIENVLRSGAIRISTSNHTVISNSVIRDKVEGLKGDNVGILVGAVENQVSLNTKIYNNEIINYTDGIQLLYYTTPSRNKPVTGELPGTYIGYNDIYITPDLYRQKENRLFSCAENGIDIKVGSSSKNPLHWVTIENNNLWGFRDTDSSCSGSSNGEAITIHRNAKNVLLKDNVIFDSSRGVTVGWKNNRFPDEEVDLITISNNLLFDFYHADEKKDGIGFILSGNTRLVNNTLKGIDVPLIIENNKKRHQLDYNVFIGTRRGAFYNLNKSSEYNCNIWLDYKANDLRFKIRPRNKMDKNSELSQFENYSFQIKKWTDPQLKIATNVAVNTALEQCECRVEKSIPIK